MSDALAWVKFIIGLIFVPSVRVATRRALTEWADNRDQLADEPSIDDRWLAARDIDRRRAGLDDIDLEARDATLAAHPAAGKR